MVVQLRPGRPTVEEGERFARYLNEAADGVFQVLLGGRYARIIGQAYTSPGHDLSHQTAVFAQDGGTIVGMASGYSSEYHQGSTDQPLQQAAGWRVVRMAALSALGRGMLAFMDRVPDGDFYLQAVAVDEDQRGRGVGSVLIDDVEKRAADSGCRRLALDVAKDNEGARRLYERRGMEIEAESPRLLLTPGSGVFRMVKTI